MISDSPFPSIFKPQVVELPLSMYSSENLQVENLFTVILFYSEYTMTMGSG